MNIPTHCTNCDTTEGVRLQCKGCNFARFCSRDCQKKCWKKHKRYCMPLTDAVNESIQRFRQSMRDHFRIDVQDGNLSCMFCLEGGTSEDSLFYSGCACRPDSGMSIGHIKCFQEFARASFADKKKREDFVCRVLECSHCSQDRYGFLAFEMLLILCELYDPDCLTRQNFQDVVDISQKERMRKAFEYLNYALYQTNIVSTHHKFIHFCRLRIFFLIKNVHKQNQKYCSCCSSDFERLKNEMIEDFDIGSILNNIEKHQAAIYFSRRNYEKFQVSIIQYPQLNILRYGVVGKYAQSLYDAFSASLKSDVGNDPPYHYLEEAETLMRDPLLENLDDIDIYGNNAKLLCQILIAQRKYDEAKQILSPCLEKVQRVLGDSHDLTTVLLQIEGMIRSHF